MRNDHLSLKGCFGPGHPCYVTAFGPITPPSLDNPCCVVGKLVASIQDAMLSRVVTRPPPPPFTLCPLDNENIMLRQKYYSRPLSICPHASLYIIGRARTARLLIDRPRVNIRAGSYRFSIVPSPRPLESFSHN